MIFELLTKVTRVKAVYDVANESNTLLWGKGTVLETAAH